MKTVNNNMAYMAVTNLMLLHACSTDMIYLLFQLKGTTFFSCFMDIAQYFHMPFNCHLP